MSSDVPSRAATWSMRGPSACGARCSAGTSATVALIGRSLRHHRWRRHTRCRRLSRCRRHSRRHRYHRRVAWLEVGDRVFTWRFKFFDQQIGAILGGRDVAVVDTRSTPVQAGEIVAALRELTSDPVSIVLNTHWHWDHTFGNSVFRPATIWGHARVPGRLLAQGPGVIEEVAEEMPALAEEIRQVVLDPPERTFDVRATVEIGDRAVELEYLGRGHTDTDVAITVPDAVGPGRSVLFAGDLLE